MIRVVDLECVVHLPLTSEQLAANPMQLVGRPKLARPLPKALLFMHAWAEPQHDMGYKGQTLDRDTERELAWAAASAWGADRTFDEIAPRLAGEPTK
jgi:hypothetical protein